MPPCQASLAIGQLLRRRRLDRRLSRMDIATKTGLAYNTIRNIEDGYHTPSITAVIAYCNALNLRLEITSH